MNKLKLQKMITESIQNKILQLITESENKITRVKMARAFATAFGAVVGDIEGAHRGQKLGEKAITLILKKQIKNGEEKIQQWQQENEPDSEEKIERMQEKIQKWTDELAENEAESED